MTIDTNSITFDKLSINRRIQLRLSINEAFKELSGESSDSDPSLEDVLSGGSAGQFDAKALQNRDRSRQSYIEQMNKIANNPDYDRISASKTADSGAPMVFVRGQNIPAKQSGKKEVITMSDGKGGSVKIPAVYAVVEAEKLIASHDASGGKVESYGGNNGIMALNNGRTAALKRAYMQGTANEYYEALLNDTASHGIPSSVIESVNAPVLVRVFSESSLAGIDDVGTASNVSAGAELSDSEQAHSDAGRIDSSVVMKYQGGDINTSKNREFVREFISSIGGIDAAGKMVTDDGLISQYGIKRIQSALVSKAFDDKDIVESLSENPDDEIKSLGNVMKDISGRWAIMREAVDNKQISDSMDITKNIVDAINLVRKSRQKGVKLSELVNQSDMFSGDTDPLTETLLRLMFKGDDFNRVRSADKISRALHGFLDKAMASTASADMFGFKAEAIDALSQEQENLVQSESANKAQKGLFDSVEYFEEIIKGYNEGMATLDAVNKLTSEDKSKLRKYAKNWDTEDSKYIFIDTKGNVDFSNNLDCDGYRYWSYSALKDILGATFDSLAEAAKAVNTNPTESQKESGRYKKGYTSIHGLKAVIENPKGSTRSGTDKDGSKWSSKMTAHYGYFSGTDGADGDEVDVFFGELAESDNPKVFVVNQVDDKGKFDEHKVMFGYADLKSAKKGYLSNYSDGWQGLGSIKEVGLDELKEWLFSGKSKKVFDNVFDSANDSGQKLGIMERIKIRKMINEKFALIEDGDLGIVERIAARKVINEGFLRLSEEGVDSDGIEEEQLEKPPTGTVKVLGRPVNESVLTDIDNFRKQRKEERRQAELQQIEDGKAWLDDMTSKGIDISKFTELLSGLVKVYTKEMIDDDRDIAAVSIDTRRKEKEIEGGLVELQREAAEAGYHLNIQAAKQLVYGMAKERYDHTSELAEKLTNVLVQNSIDEMIDTGQVISQKAWSAPKVAIRSFSDDQLVKAYRQLESHPNYKPEALLLAIKYYGDDDDIKIAQKMVSDRLNDEQASIDGVYDALLAKYQIQLNDAQIEMHERAVESGDHAGQLDYDKVVELRRSRAIARGVLDVPVTDEDVSEWRELVSRHDYVKDDQVSDHFITKYDIHEEDWEFYADRVREAYAQVLDNEFFATDEVKASQLIVEGLKSIGFGAIKLERGGKAIADKAVGIGKVIVLTPKFKEGYLSISLYYSSDSRIAREPTEFKDLKIDLDTGAVLDSVSPAIKQPVVSSIVGEADKFTNRFKTIIDTSDLPVFGSGYNEIESGDRYNQAKYSSKIRALINASIKSGSLPKGLKVSVTSRRGYGSVGVEIKSLPSAISLFSNEFLKWVNDNPDDKYWNAPYEVSRFSRDYLSLEMALKAYGEKWRRVYDPGDVYTDLPMSDNYHVRVSHGLNESDQIAHELALFRNEAVEPEKTEEELAAERKAQREEESRKKAESDLKMLVSDGEILKEENGLLYVNHENEKYPQYAHVSAAAKVGRHYISVSYYPGKDDIFIATKANGSIGIGKSYKSLEKLKKALPKYGDRLDVFDGAEAELRRMNEEPEETDIEPVIEPTLTDSASIFKPTHTLSEGTPVRPHPDEDNVWIDAGGEEWEADSDEVFPIEEELLPESFADIEKEVNEALKSKADNDKPDKPESIEDGRNEIEDSEHARIAKRVYAALGAEFTQDEAEAAVKADKEGKKFSFIIRELIAKSIVDHHSGDYPLPMRGINYTKDQWNDIRNSWLQNNPEITKAYAEIEQIKKRVEGYMEQGSPDGLHYFRHMGKYNSVFTMLKTSIDDFRSQTYYSAGSYPKNISGFQAIKEKILENIERTMPYVRAMDNEAMYKDAQLFVDTLSGAIDGDWKENIIHHGLQAAFGINDTDKKISSGAETVAEFKEREAKEAEEEKAKIAQREADHAAFKRSVFDVIKDFPAIESSKTKAVNALRKAGYEVKGKGTVRVSNGAWIITPPLNSEFPFSSVYELLKIMITEDGSDNTSRDQEERAALLAEKNNLSDNELSDRELKASERLEAIVKIAEDIERSPEIDDDLKSESFAHSVIPELKRRSYPLAQFVSDMVRVYGVSDLKSFYQRVKDSGGKPESSGDSDLFDQLLAKLSERADLIKTAHDFSESDWLPVSYKDDIYHSLRKLSGLRFQEWVKAKNKMAGDVDNQDDILAQRVHEHLASLPIPDLEPDIEPWKVSFEEWQKVENKGGYGPMTIKEWRNAVGQAISRGESMPNEIAREGSIKFIPKEKIAEVYGEMTNDIPYDMAYRAHTGTSHVPEDRARQEIVGYAEYLQSVKQSLLEYADDDDQKAIAESEFTGFREGYKKRKLSELSTRQGMMSSMISGPANFPVARMEKINRSHRNKSDEMIDWAAKYIKRAKKTIKPVSHEIRGDQDGALDLLKKKLEGLEKSQELMKAANKIIRSKKITDKTAALLEIGLSEKNALEIQAPDFAGRVGFPSYALTNNNANIKRIKSRIIEQQALDKEVDREFAFNGGTVEVDTSDMRIRIFHDEKPDADARSELKRNGFKWSRYHTAWQRQLTDNAKYAVRLVTGVDVDKPQATLDSVRPAQSKPKKMTIRQKVKAKRLVMGI